MQKTGYEYRRLTSLRAALPEWLAAEESEQKWITDEDNIAINISNQQQQWRL